jgi:hypothetical protein
LSPTASTVDEDDGLLQPRDDGEGDADLHAARQMLVGRVDEGRYLGEFDDLVEARVDLRPRHAVQSRRQIDVVPDGEVGDEAARDLDQRRHAAVDLDGAGVGQDDFGDQLQQRRLPCPLRPTTPIASPGRTSNETSRRAQNSPGRDLRLLSEKRSLNERRPRRLRRKRMPTPSTRMTGSTEEGAGGGTDMSDLLQDGTFAGSEDEESDTEDEQAHPGPDEHLEQIELVGEERRSVETEDSAQRIEGREQMQALRRLFVL